MEAEKKMVRKDIRPEQIVEELKRLYPKRSARLPMKRPLAAFLVMARLSAQCTDARVNQVCETLFQVYP